MIPDTLRGQVALAAGACLAVVLAAVGIALVRTTRSDDLEALDRRMERQARLLARPGTLEIAAARPDAARPLVGALLNTTGTGVLIRDGGTELVAAGELPDVAPGTYDRTGVFTIRARDGEPWRAAVTRIPGTEGAVTVTASLAPLRERARTLRRRVIVLGAVGVLGAAGLAALAAGLVLRPLRRLRGTAERVAETRELTNRVPVEGTREVRDVATALNGMLGQLEVADAERVRALTATQRFAADAGHELRTPLATLGANLDTLARRPDLEPAERAEILAESLDEQRRLATLTAALQDLMRGDAGAAGDEEPVDVREVAGAAAASLRARHPAAVVRVIMPEDPVVVVASPWGLRLALDNLLENAARHAGNGRRPTIEVAVVATAEGARLRVDDDGPGITAAERTRVLERFSRGTTAAPGGSGLGLSLVAQQAQRHGGAVTIGDSPLGGARVEVTLAR